MTDQQTERLLKTLDNIAETLASINDRLLSAPPTHVPWYVGYPITVSSPPGTNPGRAQGEEIFPVNPKIQ